jgi:hypothetical protein
MIIGLKPAPDPTPERAFASPVADCPIRATFPTPMLVGRTAACIPALLVRGVLQRFARGVEWGLLR